MSIWEKLMSVPREIIMGLVLIAILIPALNPLGLPLMVGSMSEDWYDTVDNMPAGSIVLFDIGYGSGGYPSLGPGNIAAFHHEAVIPSFSTNSSAWSASHFFMMTILAPTYMAL